MEPNDTNGPKYEYHIAYVLARDTSLNLMEKGINALASKGWRLVAVSGNFMYFERLKAEGEE